jgi:hypothetical protein
VIGVGARLVWWEDDVAVVVVVVMMMIDDDDDDDDGVGVGTHGSSFIGIVWQPSMVFTFMDIMLAGKATGTQFPPCHLVVS